MVDICPSRKGTVILVHQNVLALDVGVPAIHLGLLLFKVARSAASVIVRIQERLDHYSAEIPARTVHLPFQEWQFPATTNPQGQGGHDLGHLIRRCVGVTPLAYLFSCLPALN